MMQLELRQTLRLELRQILRDLSGLEGTPENLLEVLEVPQISKRGKINYLVGGGWAVEILTSEDREHHDIDLIVLDKQTPLYFGTDIRKPRNYFTIISTTAKDIRENHSTISFWPFGDRDIYIPTAEFLLVSKIYGGFGLEPRKKDYEDASAILRTQSINSEKLKLVFEKTKALNISECTETLVEFNQEFIGSKEIKLEDLVKLHRLIQKPN